MIEVNVEDYQGRKRNYERFLANEEERQEMPLYQKAGLGAIAAAGALFLGYRSGAIRRIANFLDTEAKMSLQAAKEIIEEEDLLSRNYQLSRIKELKDRFQDRREKLLKQQQKQPEDILQSREFDMERILKQRSKFIGYADQGQIEGEVPFAIEEGLRFQEIMKDIRRSQHDRLKDNEQLHNQIERALGKGNIGDLNYRDNDHIRYLLENGEIADGDVIQEVIHIRNQHRNRRPGAFLLSHSEGVQWVKGMQQKLREFTAEQMQEATKRNGAFREFLIGHRQATIGDIRRLHQEGHIRLNKELEAKINDVLKYNKNFDEAVFDENLYIKEKTGELIDYKAIDNLKRRQLEWWANTLPGSLLHLEDILNIKIAREQAAFRIMQRGTIQPALNAQRGIQNTEPLNEELLYINGKIVKLFDHQAVNNNNKALEILNDRDMYLTSSRFGTIPKLQRHVANLMTPDKERDWFSRLLDLRNQERDTGLVSNISIFTKWLNPDYERNRIIKAFRSGIHEPGEYYDLQKYFNRYTKGYSTRTLNHITEYMPEDIQRFIENKKLHFSRDEDFLKLFEYLGEHHFGRPGDAMKNYNFYSMLQQYKRNPDEFLGKRIPIGEKNPLIGGRVKVQTGMDQIRQQTSIELTRQMLERGRFSHISGQPANLDESGVRFLDIFKEMQKEKKISKKDQEQSEWLFNQFMFQEAGRYMHRNREEALSSVNELFTGDKAIHKRFQANMSRMVKKTNPWYEFHSNIRPANQIEDEFILVNRAFKSQTLGERVKEFFTDFQDKMKQMSLTTGRRNMEDFTTLSMPGMYLPYRLQDALGHLGLGFSDDSMGSPLQLWSQLFLKRVAPAFTAVSGYQYIDYQLENTTGASIDERIENYKAYKRLDEAQAREEMGHLEILHHQRMLRPGIEHWEAMPSIELPILGDFGPGHLLNEFFGALNPFMANAPFKEESMSQEETYEDITEGVDEIRKGRWWAFGSKTAYRGGRVIEYQPSSYRRAHSGWEDTDTIASPEEKYANSFFPTFENPLGALGYILGTADPYWFEKKHYYDRPYLLTGELFNANTPIIGDIGNMTLGALLKPVRPMHTEYWGDPVIVQEEADALGDRPEQPLEVRVSPAGRTDVVVPATPDEYGAESVPVPLKMEEAPKQYQEEVMKMKEQGSARNAMTYIKVARYNEKGEATGDVVVYDKEASEGIYIPARLQGKYETTEQAFRAAKADQHPRIIDTRPRGIHQTELVYREQLDREKLKEIQDPRSVQWRTQELASNWMEPHGIYNWILIDEIMGRDPYAGTITIQRADDAYNASQAFSEQELGSLGGALSEIGRRFIRRDSGQLDKYNPIRNTMPDWLPGGNYFINFQVGDPYSKIPHGEYRLPGEAYESLNELHSDETGKYGAFDKFKILADVAPWSDEYKFWKDYVEEYIDDKELRKQAAQIKRQVAKRKEKYEFYEYKFKDAELEKYQVTVTRFLDDYTFLTEEFGDQPVRMAGVDVRANAEGVLQQYFQPGDTITIGVNKHPSQRIEDDTYRTMKAVVFRGIESLNRQIIERGEMKELESDDSPVGIWARFTPEEIWKGTNWERMAHADTALNTKFLQVRSALEEYERDQIYGKDWATWENFGISDYLIPAIHEMAGEENPIPAVLSGLATGGVIGRFIFNGGSRTKWGAAIGALTGLSANMYGQYYEHQTEEQWIPKRRRIEQEINEYFDILKYMKYSGLYERAKAELAHQGYDIEPLMQEIEERQQYNKEKRHALEEEKRQLYINQPKGWKKRRTEINKELESISEDWLNLRLPPAVIQALYYKEQAETTLYGVDPYEDRLKIMKALPYKDKWFFNEFAEATPEEQERILELIPENQKRIYKAIWGREVDPKKPLEYYATKYYIPGPNWKGWEPSVSLEDIKVQVVEEEGLDLSDFNYWNDDIAASQQVPSINEQNEYLRDEIPFRGYREVEKRIRAIMQGQGLKDIRVTIRPSTSTQTQVNIHYEQDRREEIESHFRENMEEYM